jgi:hypothetical protein
VSLIDSGTIALINALGGDFRNSNFPFGNPFKR